MYNEDVSTDAAYPSILPSIGDSPEYDECMDRSPSRHDSPVRNDGDATVSSGGRKDFSFAPPGPCYVALKNNVSTIEMEMTFQKWRPGTDEFVPHHVLAQYLEDAVLANDITDLIQLNTRVNSVVKDGSQWRLGIAQRLSNDSTWSERRSTEVYRSSGACSTIIVADNSSSTSMQ